jgi:peptidoglycan/xylan/chitin deacetylase (PgdA/CDA1 family)
LSEIVKTLKKGEQLSPRTVCITFDDGVRNTYEVAFPILLSMKVPATVFLVTGAMDTEKPIWTDLVACLISQYGGKKLTLSGNGMKRTFVTGTENEKVAALSLLKRWLKAVPDAERERIVEALSRMVPAPEERSMMTWDEAREMAASGIEFGAHTVSHPILSRVDGGVLEKEIQGSKQRIEEMTGKPVTLFAYPNGEKEDFDARAVSVLQANGFSAACTTMVGINRDIEEPFLLKRIPGFEEPLGMLAFRLLGYRG